MALKSISSLRISTLCNLNHLSHFGKDTKIDRLPRLYAHLTFSFIYLMLENPFSSPTFLKSHNLCIHSNLFDRKVCAGTGNTINEGC